ncbi:hypothetical protein [Lacticaseibacillus paracasei]|uniref:Uncharacterized protein n=1 Tax=Lacticaseibacillus paracasei NRIC 0644 TaxID=1435038 RepID=A0A0C9PL59_LACPA|nr:hypothetical protein [Lacticaseibacillus paracasei]MXI84423.1 hypothetical protein [Lacticaseibacillus paracasei]URW91759.1 hypothetical protein NCY29_01745 [Lacticaseibacillus paracasei]GAN35691.1 hypothetical protein LC0644_0280 [Lacticaseibacillus paracasei NRIC 0644]GAN38212.1 hypothetical protein LC1917_0089 [Lacticaseibacillus paracasei NRIC 1917]
MKKAYNIAIIAIYFGLLANMVVGFLPNYIAITLALLILVPLIVDKLKHPKTNPSKKNS